MPGKRRYRRKIGRKGRPRRFARRGGITTVNRTKEPVAKRLITTLKYFEVVPNILVNSITGIDYQFRLNSLFDPNYTGVGHQPYGFDSLTGLYNRYRVYKVTGYVKLDTNTAIGSHWTLLANNDATGITNFELASEMPHSMTKFVAPETSATIKFRFYPAKITGVTSAVYKADDRFQAVYTTNPTEAIHMHLCGKSTGAETPVNATFCLKFHCELFDPHPLAQS